MDEFKIDQLTKELVAEELKRIGDPCATAANLVKQTLSVALKGLKPGGAGPAKVIEDACRGGIVSLMLAQHNVGKGAVLILGAVAELSTEFQFDATALLRCALRGIADVRRFIGSDELRIIQHQIESHYLGAGDYFADLVKGDSFEPAAKAAPPR